MLMRSIFCLCVVLAHKHKQILSAASAAALGFILGHLGVVAAAVLHPLAAALAARLRVSELLSELLALLLFAPV